MAEAGSHDLVDLSETDPTALNPTASNLPKGSVLEHALARLRQERARGVSEYASFINTTDLPRRARDEDG